MPDGNHKSFPYKHITRRDVTRFYIKEQNLKNAPKRDAATEAKSKAQIKTRRNVLRLYRKFRKYFYGNARNIAPAATKEPPIAIFQVIVSLKNIKARSMAKTTLSLSIGATRDAGPNCSAR